MAEVTIKLTAESAEALRRIKQFTKGIEDSWKAVRAGDPALQGSTLKVGDLARAKGEATRATTQWRDALGQLPGPIGEAARQTSRWVSLLKGPAGVVGAIGLVTAAGVGLAKSLANDIERLENMSRVTGLSVAALQTFEHVAKQAGEAPEGLVQGLGKINTAIAEVLTGSDSAGKAFGAIGVDLRQLVKDGASTEQILEATAKALAAIPDPTRQAAAMADIFGVRSRALQIALLQVATEGIGPLITEMKRLGIVTSEETIAAAKHVDQMADRFDQAIDRMIKKAKQYAVEAVSDLAKAGKITADILGPGADPARAGQLLRGQLLSQGAEPGSVERQAGRRAPRVLSPTAAEESAAKAAAAARQKAIEDNARAYGEMADEAIASFEIIRQADDKRWAEMAERAAQGAQDVAAAIGAAEGQAAQEVIDATDAKAAADAAQREAQVQRAEGAAHEIAAIFGQLAQDEIDQYEESLRGQQAQLDAFLATTSAGRVRAIEAERDQVRALLDRGVLDVQATEDAKLRILELTLARDLELERQKVDGAFELRIAGQEQMNALLAQRVSADERAAAAILEHQILVATEAGNAWGVFTGRFQQEAASWGTSMERFGTLGADVARELHTAFKESFFDLIKGDFDDFDDIWKTFLNAILRMIADFMAAEAVQGFIKLGKLIVDEASSSSNAGAGADTGGSDFNIWDPDTWFQKQQQQQQQRLTLEQQTTDESQKRLELEQQRTIILEEAKNQGGVVGRGILGGIGGIVGAAGGGATPLGPLGAIAGGLAGRAIFGFVGEKLGDFIGSLIGLSGVVDQATVASNAATAQFNTASRESVVAFDRMTRESVQLSAELDKLAPSTIDLTTATTDLTAAQTDLAIETFDVTTSAQDASKSLAGTVDALDRLGTEAVNAGDRISQASDDIAAASPTPTPGAPTPTPGAPTPGPEPAFGPGPGPPGFAGTGPGQSPGPAGDPGGATGPGIGAGPSADAPGGGDTGSQKQLRRDAEVTREEIERAEAAARRLRIEFDASLLSVDELTLELTDTSAGVGIAAEEARRFVASLVSGVAPTSEYTHLFQALAQEHGPGFTAAVEEALLAMGLNLEAAQGITAELQGLTDGFDVPVHYRISVSGSPPPGAGGPPITAPGLERGLHGGWVGQLPAYNAGGWITDGVWDRDSVMAMLARGEYVLQASAAGYNPAFTSAYNRDPARALAGVAAGGGGSDPADRALMEEQNTLLREQNRILRELARRRPGGNRPAGGVV